MTLTLSPTVQKTQDGSFKVVLPTGAVLVAGTRFQMKAMLERMGYSHPWYCGN